jgi:hypothetical protein
MRYFPAYAGLLPALLALLLAACEPEPPRAEDLPADASPLIVQAAGSDDFRAWRAQQQLKSGGHCPYLPDSPEGPVGLAAASFGQPGSDGGHTVRTLRLLLQLGCDINQYSAVGLTPLHGAVIGRQPVLLQQLLELGADPLLRVIPIPGSELGRSIAHLDAYGLALVLREKFPDDPAVREILERLKPPA